MTNPTVQNDNENCSFNDDGPEKENIGLGIDFGIPTSSSTSSNQSGVSSVATTESGIPEASTRMQEVHDETTSKQPSGNAIMGTKRCSWTNLAHSDDDLDFGSIASSDNEIPFIHGKLPLFLGAPQVEEDDEDDDNSNREADRAKQTIAHPSSKRKSTSKHQRKNSQGRKPRRRSHASTSSRSSRRIDGNLDGDDDSPPIPPHPRINRYSLGQDHDEELGDRGWNSFAHTLHVPTRRSAGMSRKAQWKSENHLAIPKRSSKVIRKNISAELSLEECKPIPETIRSKRTSDASQPQAATRHKVVLSFIVAIVCLLVIAIAVVLGLLFVTVPDDSKVPTTAPTRSPPQPAPTIATLPTHTAPSSTIQNTAESEGQSTFQKILSAQSFKCGIIERPAFSRKTSTSPQWIGFDVDLCLAVGAAILKDTNLVEFVSVTTSDRFVALHEQRIDMLAGTTTFTMERDVYEPTAGAGFSFSTPYLYSGLVFGGLPNFVSCAENLDTTGECLGLRICVLDDTTHSQLVKKLMPDANLLVKKSMLSMYEALGDSSCHVIASEQFSISASAAVANGYTGDYQAGQKKFSHEPIALVTREHDVHFSEFVNWIVQALLLSEKQGISKNTASSMGTAASVFGPDFGSALVDAIGAVGNYGDLYQRHLEGFVARQEVNMINEGNSGLIYAMPYGNLETIGPKPNGTLLEVLSRGYLRCGVSERSIFAEFDRVTSTWSGIDIDLCRAVSAAIFDGVFSTVAYVNLTATERFPALASGSIDLLARTSAITIERDVNVSQIGTGFSFTQPCFFDEIRFGGIPRFVRCAEELDVGSENCQGVQICVLEGTIFENHVQQLFPARLIVPMPSELQVIEGFRIGMCNVIAGGFAVVSSGSVEDSGYNGTFVESSSLLSISPTALATRDDDALWSSFVYWMVSSLFDAEERGVNQTTSNQMPVVNLFGQINWRIFRDAVAAVGSFEDIWNRNVPRSLERHGLNQLNTNPLGPQHYPVLNL